MIERFDVAIIGAGTAGISALNEVRKRTDRFVLINDGPYGTTCARVGCMPSKALIESARAYHRRTVFGQFGIRGSEALSVDVPSVLARVRRLRDEFVSGTLRATNNLGDRNIAGRARFLEPDTLSVNGRTIRAERIIIATGSRPILPEAWRFLGDKLLTSDNIFEQQDLPPAIAVVGLGPVGAEIAQALSRLGVRLEAFDLGIGVAGLADPVVNRQAISYLGEEFAIHLGSPVDLSADGEKVRVKAGETSVVVDKVFAALGRRPNVDDLGLDRLGVPLDNRGLPSFDPCSMQIADLPVFIAGDSNNRSPFMHEAVDDGHIAGTNATTSPPRRYARRTPLAIVFTEPDIAMVGHRFPELEERTTIIGEADFSRQGRALTAGTNRGIVRIYGERESGLLLGAEMCAPEGEHLAHFLALAIERNLTVRDLLRTPFYHPVVEEGLRGALRGLARQLPVQGLSDLDSCEAFGNNALD